MTRLCRLPHIFLKPLDDFCSVMQLEIQKILITDPPVAERWLYSSENRPFGPMCSLTATQLSELPIQEAKEILKSVSQTAIISSETDYMTKRPAKSTSDLRKRKPSSKGYQSISM